MGVYSVLLIGRILSGVGEAALISLVPPLIMKKAEGPAIGIKYYKSSYNRRNIKNMIK